MVPGHVQSLSRVPPDQPGGGAGGELDSGGLRRTPRGECGLRSAKCGIARQSRLKPLSSHLQATTKPHQSRDMKTQQSMPGMDSS